jgi:arylformamidase
MSEWIDVSVPLKNGMVHWPGDKAFSREYTQSIEKGDQANVSEMTGSAHTGTHMDAPAHFINGGHTIDTIPLDACMGRARVIRIEDAEVIRVAELEPHKIAAGERVLFRTKNSDYVWKTDTFQTSFVHIPGDTARWLAERGVKTVGVDYLSVGGYESDGAETHRALLGAGVWIIEGLVLTDIAAGEYDLICLPLKIVGSDGAPARALLRKIA